MLSFSFTNKVYCKYLNFCNITMQNIIFAVLVSIVIRWFQRSFKFLVSREMMQEAAVHRALILLSEWLEIHYHCRLETWACRYCDIFIMCRAVVMCKSSIAQNYWWIHIFPLGQLRERELNGFSALTKASGCLDWVSLRAAPHGCCYVIAGLIPLCSIISISLSFMHCGIRFGDDSWGCVLQSLSIAVFILCFQLHTRVDGRQLCAEINRPVAVWVSVSEYLILKLKMFYSRLLRYKTVCGTLLPCSIITRGSETKVNDTWQD